MNRFIKKIVAVIAVFTVLSFVGGSAFALTADELQAQINALLAQLSTLQAQLAQLGGSTGAISCTITSFTNNLSMGSTGTDVQCLQKILNSDPATQVASSGAGSPGNETTYFGSLTQAAVIQFQNKYASTVLTPLGLTAGTGFVGAATRSKLNTFLGGGVTPPTGCTSDTQCATGYMCSASVCVLKSTGGKEGSYTVAIASTPVSATIDAGNDIPVYGVTVKAYNSDIIIQRIDLQVAVTVGTTTYSPATLVTGIGIFDGATLLTHVTNPVFTKDSSSYYFTQVTGFNFLVPVNTSKTFTVKVDTITGIDTNRSLVVNVYGSGIRGVDGAGLSTYALLATTRTYTIQVPGNSTLTATASTDMPVSTNLAIDSSLGVENVTLLKFNLKSTISSSNLTNLTLEITSSGSSAVPSVVKLYDGDTLIQSAVPFSGSSVGALFTDFTLPVAKDQTKSMTIKGDFAALTALSSNIVNCDIPIDTAGANDSTYERSSGAVVETSVPSAVTANPQFLFEKGVKFAFSKASNVVSPSGASKDGSASGQIEFTVQPFGATLTQFAYASSASGTTASVMITAYDSSGTAWATGAARTVTTSPIGDTAADSSATVIVNELVTVSTGASGPGLMRFKIDGIDWNDGTALDHWQGGSTTAGNMFDTFVTPYADLR